MVSIRAAAQLQVVHRAKIAAGIQLHAVGRGDRVIPDGEAANRPTSGVDVARNVEGACAVSYTHLDVYKRQPYYSRNKMCRFSANSNSIRCYHPH